MKPGVLLSLALVLFGCREDQYRLRTETRLAGDGRAYLAISVYRGNERVFHHSDIDMNPNLAERNVSQSPPGPEVSVSADFDREGRGALVRMRVTDEDGRVIAQDSEFVDRPAPPGYVRAGLWIDPPKPVMVGRFFPKYPEKALRNRRQGIVYVDALINTNGTVDRVTVLNPSPNFDGLDEAAADAVLRSRFRLSTWAGKGPFATAAVQAVDFELR